LVKDGRCEHPVHHPVLNSAPNNNNQMIGWSVVATRIGLLAALLVVSAFLATRAFDSYQRSL
jgi:hypothetical protein